MREVPFFSTALANAFPLLNMSSNGVSEVPKNILQDFNLVDARHNPLDCGKYGHINGLLTDCISGTTPSIISHSSEAPSETIELELDITELVLVIVGLLLGTVNTFILLKVNIQIPSFLYYKIIKIRYPIL